MVVPVGSLAPIGSIVGYMGSAASIVGTGWLECNGQGVTSAAYPLLYAVIGHNFGGQGGTFNLPDLRGQFLRGVDDSGRNIDPDAASRAPSATGLQAIAPGSSQPDAFGAHSHNTYSGLHGIGSAYPGSSYPAVAADEGQTTPVSTVGASVETRPKNVYVYWIIKAA